MTFLKRQQQENNSMPRLETNTPNAINVLRVVACFMVLILHTLIHTKSMGFNLYAYEHTHPWIFLLKTPAWAGVWIFFILSAYLAGRGFFLGRYEYSARGFGRYYVKKVLRIIIPVYAFIILVCTLVFPKFLYENPIAIKRLLLFRYTGSPGVAGIGVLWYISTVMPIYILAPFICLALDKTLGVLCKKKPTAGKLTAAALLLAIVALGYVNRILLLRSGVGWYLKVYVSTLANFDLFLCGFLLNFITLKDNPQKKLPEWARLCVKIGISLLLTMVIAYTCYLYFVGEPYDASLLNRYRYHMPTAFLISVCLYLFAFDYEKPLRQAPLTLENTIKNPLRILDFLAGISFEIYMFHSVIYECIQPCFTPIETIGGHVGFILLGTLLSSLFGYAFHRIFQPQKHPPREKKIDSSAS